MNEVTHDDIRNLMKSLTGVDCEWTLQPEVYLPASILLGPFHLPGTVTTTLPLQHVVSHCQGRATFLESLFLE